MKQELVCAMVGALVFAGCGGSSRGPGGATTSSGGGAFGAGGSGSGAAAGDEDVRVPWDPANCQIEGLEDVHCFDADLLTLASDPSGAFLIGGEFVDTLAWGPSVLATSYEYGTPFVGKLDAQQKPMWAAAYLGLDTGSVRDIATDSQGNSYVTGTATRAKYPGESAPYLVKLSPDGELLWRRTFTPYPNVSGYGSSVAIGQDGTILLVGTGKIDVEPTDFGDPDYPVYGSGETFAIAFDVDGKAKWEHWMGSALGGYARTAAATPDGGFVVSTEDADTFGLMKVAASGEREWAFYGSGYGAFSVLAVADDGSVRAAGVFMDWIDVAGVVAQSSSWGLVALELDKDGNPAWAFAHKSNAGLILAGALPLATGELLLLSDLNEDANDVFGKQTVVGASDVWVGLLDGDGKPQGAVTYGGVDDEQAGQAALDGAGRPWALGTIRVDDDYRSMLMRVVP